MKYLKGVHTILGWCLIAFGLSCFSLTALANKYLSAEEINQLISGKTVEAENPRRATSSVTYFDPDGTFRQLLEDKPEKGTWSVNDNDYLCTNREAWGSSCRKISKEGDVWKLYKVPEKATKQIEHKKTYLRILDGNPNNL